MTDPYYEPAEFGLELVGSVDEDGLSYEFNMFAVWRDKDTGQLYYAEDNGCSCPSPFEDFYTKEDLTLARNVHDVFDALDGWVKGYDDTDNPSRAEPAMELRATLASL